jgi:hypothetical protein
MFHKKHTLLSTLFIAALAAVLVVSPTLAATSPAPATGTTAASGPLPGWVEVEPGATQWYRFKYTYTGDSEEDAPAQAIVELQMAAPSGVIFEIWTPGRLNAPLPDPALDEQEGMVREPVGMGTPRFVETTWHWEGTPHHKHYVDVYNATDLIWAGSATATDTYYIVVKNKGAEIASYKLSVTGPTVSF